MNKIKIIVDSTADLMPDYIKENDIHVVGLSVTFGEETFTDGVDITTEELYQKVKQTKKLPKTSAISIPTLIDIFKTYIDEGYDILYTGISSKMSSSYNAACLASQEFPEGRIAIYDSYNLSTGIGLQILKAVELRNEGKSLQEIYDYLMSIRDNVRSQFVVEDVEYLHKGGRCNALEFFFARLGRIRPIISVKDGSMSSTKKIMGHIKKGLDYMVELLKNDINNLDLGTVMITSSIAPESEKYLIEQLTPLIGKEHLMVTHAGCVISSHCGPGTIGILYIVK